MMQTPDGEWRVEVYREPRTRTDWFRLVHGDDAIGHLSISSVQRLLEEAGYRWADLEDVAA